MIKRDVQYPDPRDLTSQLADLVDTANELGLYDAADFVLAAADKEGHDL